MEFKKLFEQYGFKVEEFGENSFIATNGTISIPYTEFTCAGMPLMSGVSLLATPDEIKEHYAGEKYIGHKVFGDFMNDHLKFRRGGGVCNHDHAIFEVEWWLKQTKVS